MPVTTIGRLLLEEALPVEYRDKIPHFDKKSLSEFLSAISVNDRENYGRIVQGLIRVGGDVAYRHGGLGYGIEDLSQSKAAIKARAEIESGVAKILNTPGLQGQARRNAIVKLLGKHMAKLPNDVYDESLAEGNPFALQVKSGARGNKTNLNRLRGFDVAYTDNRDRIIPIPVVHSFSTGLAPPEYWAASYGARRGIVETKMATAKAGYLAKLLSQTAHRLVVGHHDTEEAKPEHENLGLPTSTDDNDSVGSLLARPIAGLPRNTVITNGLLAELRKKKVDQILVRSPLVGGHPDGSLYGRDVGVRDFGRLAARGDMPGLSAAQALSEPVTQASLGSKHGGGVAKEKTELSGFPYIQSMVNLPSKLLGQATHAEADGQVSAIEAAPTGGFNVTVGGKEHHVPADREVTVKRGDHVEAGDVLSDGIPHPAMIAKHKGLGEARKYFVDSFRKLLTASGVRAHRRNIELIARGLMNHVRLTEENEYGVPDDVIPYSTIESRYEPREDAKTSTPVRLIGHYLEKPYLHHTVGSRVTPRMARELKDWGIQEITAHAEPPPFEPEILPAQQNLRHDPDWLVRQYGSGLKGSFLDAVHRGGKSREDSTSFVPAAARAVDFGQKGLFQPPAAGKHVDLEDGVPKQAAGPQTGLQAVAPTLPHLQQKKPSPYYSYDPDAHVSPLGQAAPYLLSQGSPFAGLGRSLLEASGPFGLGGIVNMDAMRTLTAGPYQSRTPAPNNQLFGAPPQATAQQQAQQPPDFANVMKPPASQAAPIPPSSPAVPPPVPTQAMSRPAPQQAELLPSKAVGSLRTVPSAVIEEAAMPWARDLGLGYAMKQVPGTPLARQPFPSWMGMPKWLGGAPVMAGGAVYGLGKSIVDTARSGNPAQDFRQFQESVDPGRQGWLGAYGNALENSTSWQNLMSPTMEGVRGWRDLYNWGTGSKERPTSLAGSAIDAMTGGPSEVQLAKQQEQVAKGTQSTMQGMERANEAFSPSFIQQQQRAADAADWAKRPILERILHGVGAV